MNPVRNPLRILMLNYEFPPIGGGTGVACGHLLRALGDRSDVHVDLVTSGLEPKTTIHHPAANISVHRIPVGKRKLHFWRTSELARWTIGAHRLSRRLIREGEYDLCHCWAGWPSGVVGYLVRRRLPYLVSLRGSDVPGYSPRLARLDPLVFTHLSRRVWGRAAAVVAVGSELRRLALETCPGLAIGLIPNGTDLGHFTPGRSDHDRFTILFVGRLVPRKRLAALLEAFGRVVREVADARLVVVGDGPEADPMRRLAAELGAEPAVEFLGHVPYEGLPRIYRDADVFALPSLREGMPNVVLEAMASGLPIVTTDAGAELLDGNGIAVGAGEAPDLADALLRYARDSGLRRVHGERSRELAERSSWGSVAEWYLEIYREMLARPRVVGQDAAEACVQRETGVRPRRRS